jgi:hypothetical protein
VNIIDENYCCSAVEYLRMFYIGVENFVSYKLLVPRTRIKYVLLAGSRE